MIDGDSGDFFFSYHFLPVGMTAANIIGIPFDSSNS